MLPTVEIAASCLDQVEAELDRVAPREGLAVPLVWLARRAPDPGPTATLRLEQIEKVVIARVLLVPPDKQLNSGVRVGVLGETDALVAEATRRLTRRHPRLRACAYLHSHPFARGSTWPSRGARCDYEGHMLPLLDRGLQAGLATCFSAIACRTDDGRGWLLQVFALDDDRRIVDLGFARRVPDADPDVARALLPALSRRRSARLVRAWLARLRRARVAYRADELFDGWLRIIAGSLVALVPPDFPDHAPQLFRWDRETNEIAPVPQRSLLRGGALLALARELDEEVARERTQRLLPEGATADWGRA